MYAVVETGGKQYKVMVGQTVDVERLEANVGDTVALDRVLMVADGADVRIGQPILAGAQISATVVLQSRARKVTNFKFVAKERQERKVGSRQYYTRLRIDEIKAQAHDE